MEPLTLTRLEHHPEGGRVLQAAAYRDGDGKLLLLELAAGYRRDRAGRIEEGPRLALGPEEVAALRDLLAELEES